MGGKWAGKEQLCILKQLQPLDEQQISCYKRLALRGGNLKIFQTFSHLHYSSSTTAGLHFRNGHRFAQILISLETVSHGPAPTVQAIVSALREKIATHDGLLTICNDVGRAFDIVFQLANPALSGEAVGWFLSDYPANSGYEYTKRIVRIESGNRKSSPDINIGHWPLGDNEAAYRAAVRSAIEEIRNS